MLTAARTQPSHWTRLPLNTNTSTSVASTITANTSTAICHTQKSKPEVQAVRKPCTDRVT